MGVRPVPEDSERSAMMDPSDPLGVAPARPEHDS